MQFKFEIILECYDKDGKSRIIIKNGNTKMKPLLLFGIPKN